MCFRNGIEYCKRIVYCQWNKILFSLEGEEDEKNMVEGSRCVSDLSQKLL